MDYTPQTQQAPAPAPIYELKTDVTGKEPPKRGITIITTSTGKKAKVPYPPNPKCTQKHCHGRGYVGVDTKTGNILFCGKCFDH